MHDHNRFEKVPIDDVLEFFYDEENARLNKELLVLYQTLLKELRRSRPYSLRDLPKIARKTVRFKEFSGR